MKKLTKNHDATAISSPVTIGEVYPLEITGLTAEGKGVGRVGGMAVFVSGALPGESARVKILGKKKRYAWGESVEITQESPQRVTPPCPYAACCGGCSLSHLVYEGQLGAKADFIHSQMTRIGSVLGVEPLPIIGAEKQWGYRNRVYLHYSEGELGFFAPESKKIVPISHCLLTTSNINAIIACFAREKSALAHINGLRHILVKESNTDGKCLVSFLCEGAYQQDMQKRTAFLQREDLPVVSVWYNYGRKSPWDGYFSQDWQLLYGEEKLTVSLMKKTYRWGVKDFLQVNFAQTEKLYGTAKKLLTQIPSPIAYIWDIYCGIGTIGISLASPHQQVIGIEVVSEAVESAKENAALNGVAGRYFAGLCEEILPKLLTAEPFASQEVVKKSVVILDPPRQGCDEAVLTAIAAAGFPYLIYISCHGASLARDIKILTDKGYEAAIIQPVDLFPQTGHVESIVSLFRTSPSDVIRVKLDSSDLDVTRAESEATYKEIKDYIYKEFKLKVSSLYIAQIKEKCGLKMGACYNTSKKEEHKVPRCPQEKEDAIIAALKHFRIIEDGR